MADVSARRRTLFTDWRDVQCGYLQWRTPEGEPYDLRHPPEPQVEMHAEPRGVPHGIRLEAKRATKTEPVDDWKGWGRIIYDADQGCYRTWYLEINGSTKLGSGSPADLAAPDSVVICCSESQDGFAWRETGRSPLEVPGQGSFDGVTYFVDPAAPPAERYKLVYCAQPPEEMGEALLAEYVKRPVRYQDPRIMGGMRSCLFAATSPDGLRWSPVLQPLMMHHSDTDTSVYWDAELQKYVLYTRMFRDDRRWIGRAEADDFLNWGPIEPIIWPRLDDSPDYDFYLNGRTEYPGLPKCHLMLPMVYHRFTERSEIRLYSSADGIAWNELPGGPVLEPGPPGSWDSEFLGSGKDLVPFGEGRVGVPYSGTPYPHKYPRWPSVFGAWQQGWAWWPEGRLCGLVADREGEFWTRSMIPPGRELRLNLKTHRAGLVQVGVVGAEGRSLADCDPLKGDGLAVPVRWHGEPDIKVPPGEKVRLHFRLRAAELYGLEWV
jgi:hypothetical protein